MSTTTTERKRDSRRSGPGSGGGGGPTLPLLVVAVALVAAGIGAIIVSSSYDTPREARSLGPNLAVNDGASNPRDLSANNSPEIVRNPVEHVIAEVEVEDVELPVGLAYGRGGGDDALARRAADPRRLRPVRPAVV